jgi:hypothetical protein
MPIETRLFVKAGLLWLFATFALGALMLGAKALGMAIPPGGAVVHSHMGFVGWLVNLVIGIALWFLPVNRARFKDNRGRYPIAWVRAVFVLLNGGLLLRILAEPLFDSAFYPPVTAAALLISAGMQLLAIITFIVIAWSRVRDVNPARET